MNHSKPPPRKQAVTVSAPDTGTRSPAKRANAPQPSHRDAEDTPQQRRHGAGHPGADEEMTRPSGPQESDGPCQPPRPVQCPCNKSPPQNAYLRDTLTPPRGTPPQLAPHRTWTGRLCPPHPPDHHNRGTRTPLIGRNYHIHANTSPCELVAALRRHLRGIDPNRLFAVVPLLHAAATNISVQLQALLTPGMQIADDLVEAWIWWFNFNQPDQ